MVGMNGPLFLLIWFLSIVLLYFIIKFAVKNAVKEAHWDLIESVRSIERKVEGIKNANAE
ncbi:MAG: DUF6019 family protein [Desulfitobacteriaceae bacterium]